MANWQESAKKSLDNRNYNTNNTSSATSAPTVVSAPKVISAPKSTNTWQDQAQQSLYDRNYVPPGNRLYSLKTNDGRDFGLVSYDAYMAITNNNLDNYMPKTPEEKTVIDSFKKYVEGQYKQQEEMAKAAREPENLVQGILHGIGYTAEKIGAGAVDAMADIGDLIIGGAQWLGGKALSYMPTLNDNAKILADAASQDMLKRADSHFNAKTAGDMWSESAESRYRVPDWYRTNIGQAATNFGAMIPAIASEIVTGGASPAGDTLLAKAFANQSALGLVSKPTQVANAIKTTLLNTKPSDVVFGLSATGSSAKEGYAQTGDIGKSINYGILNGLGEVATEKLFGGFGGTGIGADDAIFDVGKWASKIKGVNKLASTKFGQKVLDIAFEGVEELIMTDLNPWMQRVTINPDAKSPTWKERGESFFQGILLSGFSNAITYPTTKAINKLAEIKQKSQYIKELNVDATKVNEILPSDVSKFEPLKPNAKISEVEDRANQIQRVKAVSYFNNITDTMNLMLENEADKFVPLKYDSTEVELEERRNQIATFATGYADLMAGELVASNPELFKGLKTTDTTISIGDLFKDTKSGNTVTVVDRDAETTTVQVGEGPNAVTRKMPNSKADAFVSSGQLEKVKTSTETDVAENATTAAETVSSEPIKTINLTRVGNSYEAYGEAAMLLANELGIETTKTVVNGVETDVLRLPADLAEGFADAVSDEYNLVLSDKPKAENQSVTNETTTTDETTPPAEENTTESEISTVVSAMNDTFKPEAKEDLKNSDLKGDVVKLAELVSDFYKKNGTLSFFADYFTDKGAKVISAIEGKTDTVADTVAEESSTSADTSNDIISIIGETLTPAAKADLQNGDVNANYNSIAETLVEVYKADGTLEAFADFFVDGGKKVEAIIKENIDNAVGDKTETTDKIESSEPKVLKNESESDTIESTTETKSVEREDNGNESVREDLLHGNGKRRSNESTRKQTERLLSFRRKNKGKDARERQDFARELIERGQVEERTIGNCKYTLVNKDAYNDDMLSLYEYGKSKGIDIGICVGNMTVDVELDDGTKVTKSLRGIKVSPTRILVRYDADRSPQQIFKHEYAHSTYKTPAMQRIKNFILNSLSEETKQDILSQERYADYAETYNHNMDIVWEEFVCDVMSGYNEYYERFADTVNDYWYGNEELDSYNVAEYSESIDAGGEDVTEGRYDLSDEGGEHDEKRNNSRGISGISEEFWDKRGRNTSDKRGLSDSIRQVSLSEDFENQPKKSGKSERSSKTNMAGHSKSSYSMGRVGKRDSTSVNRRFAEALKNNDESLARALLDEQAIQNGYIPVTRYRGEKSTSVKTTFKDKDIVWVSTTFDYAEKYAQNGELTDAKMSEQLHTSKHSNVYDLYAKYGNVLELGDIEQTIEDVDDLNNFANRIGFTTDEVIECMDNYRKHGVKEIFAITYTKKFADLARKKGYDSLHTLEGDGEAEAYGILYPENVKSAKLETYDDKGKLIPLSERFDNTTDDIRYDLDEDSDGNTLTKEQQEYFKDTKVRDENGNLKVVYHGTRKADFTVFKRNINFFTDSEEMADSYSPNGEMYKGYLNITKPYEIDASGEKWSKVPIDEATKEFLQEYGASVFKEGGKWRTTPADIASAIEEAVDNGELDCDGIIIKNIDDTGSYYKGKEKNMATDYITFSRNQFKNADNTTPTSNPDIRYDLDDAENEYLELAKNPEKNEARLQEMVDEAAEKAFSNSKVRGNDGKLKLVYHGRVSDFNVFDRQFANIEGDFGKGYYFTSNEYDVDANYASEEGPDLKNKIARYAEQLEWNEEYSDLSYEEREEIARQKFITSEPNTITAYLNMENPVYITPDEKGTFLDYIEEYDEEYDEYGEPEGLLVDFIEALNNNASDYAFRDVDFSFLYEYAYDNGGVYASDAVKTIKHRIIDDLSDEEGNIATNEVIRLAFEEIGFDGIIDTSVYYKFHNMSGMDSGTTHYIVFNSEQIKSAEPVTYDDEGNVIPRSERFNEQNKDIRYDIDDVDSDGNILTKEQIEFFKDSQARDKDGNLKVLYHGSPNEFDVFDKSKSGKRGTFASAKLGFYFTDDITYAKMMGNTSDKKANVFKAYLNIKNPLRVLSTELFDEEGVAEIEKQLKGGNYDGIIDELGNYVVFESNQIKLTDNTMPTESDNIRYDISEPDKLETQKKIESIAQTVTHEELIALTKQNTQEFVDKIKENKNLQKRLHNAKRQMLLSPNPTVNATKVGKVTKDILSEMESTLKAKDLQNRVTGIYNEYFAEMKKAKGVESKVQEANDSMMKKFADLAVDIADSSVAYIESEYYASLKSYLKEVRIKIPDYAKGEAHFNEFRKAHMGTFNLTNDGLEIDRVYQELLGMFPGAFSEDATNPADQLNEIADALERLKPYAYNPHSGYMQDAIDHIVYRFVSEADGIATMPKTKAQKIAEKGAYDKEMALEKERTEFERKLDRHKENSEKTIQALQKKIDDAKYVRYWEKRLSKEEKAQAVKDVRDKRDVAILKTQIRNIVSNMKQKLDKTEKAGGYPKELVQAAAEVCSVIDFQTGRTNKDGTPTKASLKLDALKMQYDALKNSPNYDFQSEYSEEISNKILKLHQKVENKRVVDLTKTELAELKDILSEISHNLSIASKQIGRENAKANYDIATEIINSLKSDNKAISEIRNQLLKEMRLAKESGKAFVVNPHRIFEMIANYDRGSAWWQLYDQVLRGSRNVAKFTMDATMPFDELTDGGGNEIAFYDFRTKKIKTGIKYVDGTDVELPKSIICELVMLWDRKQGRSHLESGGVKIPDLKLFDKGKTADALAAGKMTNAITQSDIDRLKGMLDSYDKAWIERSRHLFNKVAKEAINETSMQLVGRELAKADNYIRIYVDSDFVKKDIGKNESDITIEGHGSLKETTPEAKNPVIARGLHENVYEHIDFAAKYYGLAIPIRNFNKVYKISINDNGNFDSVKNALGSVFGPKIRDGVVVQVIKDLQSPRHRELSFFNRVKGGWLNATFWANIRSTLKQTTSYWTASSILGEGSLVKGLASYATHRKQTKAEIAKYSGTLYKRSQGLSTTELGDRANRKRLAGLSNKTTKFINEHLPVLRKIPEWIRPGNWLQSMDCAVSSALWDACKFEVSKSMKESDDGYMKAVTDMYERVIEETQSNYDVLHRPEILKSTNAAYQTIGMFQTDNLQQTGIMYSAFGDLKSKHKAYKADKSSVNEQNLKDAKKRMGKAIRSRIYSSLWLAAVSILGDALLRKFKPYIDDEEKEITAQSVLEQMMLKMSEDMLSIFAPIVGQLGTKAMETFGEGYDFLNDPAFDVLEDFIKATSKIYKAYDEDGDILKAWTDAIPSLSNMTGVPAKNISDLFNGIKGYVGDIKAGEFAHDLEDYTSGNKSFYNYADLASYIASGDKEKETKWLDYYSANGKEIAKGSLTKEIKPAYVQMLLDSPQTAYNIKRKLVLDYDYTESAIDGWVYDEYMKNIVPDKKFDDGTVSNPEYAIEIRTFTQRNKAWDADAALKAIKSDYKAVYKEEATEGKDRTKTFAMRNALLRDGVVTKANLSEWEAEADKAIEKANKKSEAEKEKFKD